MKQLASQHALIGREVVWRFSLRPIACRGLDASRQSGDDRGRHVVLDREDVLEPPVIALGPEVTVGVGIDQLHRDSNSVTGATDAALEHKLHAKLSRNGWDIDCLSLATESRVARDYEQIANLLQSASSIYLVGLILDDLTSHCTPY